MSTPPSAVPGYVFTEGAPPYTPFFGVMGAASAMVFSGKYLGCNDHMMIM